MEAAAEEQIPAELRPLSQVLTCPLCSELFMGRHRSVVILTTCGHSFCGLCVRSVASDSTGSSVCPLCREPYDSAEHILPNRSLEHAALEFGRLAGVPAAEEPAREPEPMKDSKLTDFFGGGGSGSAAPPPKKRARKARKAAVVGVQLITSMGFVEAAARGALEARGSVQAAVEWLTENDGRVPESYVAAASSAAAPPPSPYSRHSNSALPAPRVRLPALSYEKALLKTLQLREMLEKHGLPKDGKRDALEWRHRRYLLLWNASCDEERPQSGAEIVRSVVALEKELNRSAETAASQPDAGGDVFAELINTLRPAAFDRDACARRRDAAVEDDCRAWDAERAAAASARESAAAAAREPASQALPASAASAEDSDDEMMRLFGATANAVPPTPAPASQPAPLQPTLAALSQADRARIAQNRAQALERRRQCAARDALTSS